MSSNRPGRKLLNTGTNKHNVIDPILSGAIERFFSYQDWNGLYLTGGTCLAEYYFGHRISFDMDLFTADRDLFNNARSLIAQGRVFGNLRVEAVRTMPDFCQFLLHSSTPSPLKIDLVMDIPVCLGEKKRCGSVWLDSLKDLLANKLGCLIQRSDVKDYLDLYYLIPEFNFSLSELIRIGQSKDSGLDPLILAHQIQFIQTVSKKPDYFIANVPWPQIQVFFSTWHDQILDLVKEASSSG